MIIGTAGHIDHGKTSLVRALTGVDTDRLDEVDCDRAELEAFREEGRHRSPEGVASRGARAEGVMGRRGRVVRGAPSPERAAPLGTSLTDSPPTGVVDAKPFVSKSFAHEGIVPQPPSSPVVAAPGAGS